MAEIWNTSKVDELVALIRNGHRSYVRITQILSSPQCNINARSSNGSVPLIIASEYGYITLVRLLLQYGAEVNRTDAAGWTPLMHASVRGQTEIVLLLLTVPGIDVHKYSVVPQDNIFLLKHQKEKEAQLKSKSKASLSSPPSLPSPQQQDSDIPLSQSQLPAHLRGVSDRSVHMLKFSYLEHPSISCPSQHSALTLAAVYNHLDILKILLGGGRTRLVKDLKYTMRESFDKNVFENEDVVKLSQHVSAVDSINNNSFVLMLLNTLRHTSEFTHAVESLPVTKHTQHTQQHTHCDQQVESTIHVTSDVNDYTMMNPYYSNIITQQVNNNNDIDQVVSNNTYEGKTDYTTSTMVTNADYSGFQLSELLLQLVPPVLIAKDNGLSNGVEEGLDEASVDVMWTQMLQSYSQYDVKSNNDEVINDDDDQEEEEEEEEEEEDEDEDDDKGDETIEERKHNSQQVISQVTHTIDEILQSRGKQRFLPPLFRITLLSLLSSSQSASFSPLPLTYISRHLPYNAIATQSSLLSSHNAVCEDILHVAVVYGHMSIVEYILTLMPNINNQALSLRTAFMLACKYKYYDLVELLVSAGADVSGIDVDGLCAYDYSAKTSGINAREIVIDGKGCFVDVNSESNNKDSNRDHNNSIVLKSKLDDIDKLLVRNNPCWSESNIDDKTNAPTENLPSALGPLPMTLPAVEPNFSSLIEEIVQAKTEINMMADVNQSNNTDYTVSLTVTSPTLTTPPQLRRAITHGLIKRTACLQLLTSNQLRLLLEEWVIVTRTGINTASNDEENHRGIKSIEEDINNFVVSLKKLTENIDDTSEFVSGIRTPSQHSIIPNFDIPNRSYYPDLGLSTMFGVGNDLSKDIVSEHTLRHNMVESHSLTSPMSQALLHTSIHSCVEPTATVAMMLMGFIASEGYRLILANDTDINNEIGFTVSDVNCDDVNEYKEDQLSSSSTSATMLSRLFALRENTMDIHTRNIHQRIYGPGFFESSNGLQLLTTKHIVTIIDWNNMLVDSTKLISKDTSFPVCLQRPYDRMSSLPSLIKAYLACNITSFDVAINLTDITLNKERAVIWREICMALAEKSLTQAEYVDFEPCELYNVDVLTLYKSYIQCMSLELKQYSIALISLIVKYILLLKTKEKLLIDSLLLKTHQRKRSDITLKDSYSFLSSLSIDGSPMLSQGLNLIHDINELDLHAADITFEGDEDEEKLKDGENKPEDEHDDMPFITEIPPPFITPVEYDLSYLLHEDTHVHDTGINHLYAARFYEQSQLKLKCLAQVANITSSSSSPLLSLSSSLLGLMPCQHCYNFMYSLTKGALDIEETNFGLAESSTAVGDLCLKMSLQSLSSGHCVVCKMLQIDVTQDTATHPLHKKESIENPQDSSLSMLSLIQAALKSFSSLLSSVVMSSKVVLHGYRTIDKCIPTSVQLKALTSTHVLIDSDCITEMELLSGTALSHRNKYNSSTQGNDESVNSYKCLSMYNNALHDVSTSLISIVVNMKDIIQNTYNNGKLIQSCKIVTVDYNQYQQIKENLIDLNNVHTESSVSSDDTISKQKSSDDKFSLEPHHASDVCHEDNTFSPCTNDHNVFIQNCIKNPDVIKILLNKSFSRLNIHNMKNHIINDYVDHDIEVDLAIPNTSSGLSVAESISETTSTKRLSRKSSCNENKLVSTAASKDSESVNTNTNTNTVSVNATTSNVTEASPPLKSGFLSSFWSSAVTTIKALNPINDHESPSIYTSPIKIQPRTDTKQESALQSVGRVDGSTKKVSMGSQEGDDDGLPHLVLHSEDNTVIPTIEVPILNDQKHQHKPEHQPADNGKYEEALSQPPSLTVALISPVIKVELINEETRQRNLDNVNMVILSMKDRYTQYYDCDWSEDGHNIVDRTFKPLNRLNEMYYRSIDDIDLHENDNLIVTTDSDTTCVLALNNDSHEGDFDDMSDLGFDLIPYEKFEFGKSYIPTCSLNLPKSETPAPLLASEYVDLETIETVARLEAVLGERARRRDAGLTSEEDEDEYDEDEDEDEDSGYTSEDDTIGDVVLHGAKTTSKQKKSRRVYLWDGVKWISHTPAMLKSLEKRKKSNRKNQQEMENKDLEKDEENDDNDAVFRAYEVKLLHERINELASAPYSHYNTHNNTLDSTTSPVSTISTSASPISSPPASLSSRVYSMSTTSSASPSTSPLTSASPYTESTDKHNKDRKKKLSTPLPAVDVLSVRLDQGLRGNWESCEIPEIKYKTKKFKSTQVDSIVADDTLDTQSMEKPANSVPAIGSPSYSIPSSLSNDEVEVIMQTPLTIVAFDEVEQEVDNIDSASDEESFVEDTEVLDVISDDILAALTREQQLRQQELKKQHDDEINARVKLEQAEYEHTLMLIREEEEKERQYQAELNAIKRIEDAMSAPTSTVKQMSRLQKTSSSYFNDDDDDDDDNVKVEDEDEIEQEDDKNLDTNVCSDSISTRDHPSNPPLHPSSPSMSSSSIPATPSTPSNTDIPADIYKHSNKAVSLLVHHKFPLFLVKTLSDYTVGDLFELDMNEAVELLGVEFGQKLMGILNTNR